MVLQGLKPPWLKEDLLSYWYPMGIEQMGGAAKAVHFYF